MLGTETTTAANRNGVVEAGYIAPCILLNVCMDVLRIAMPTSSVVPEDNSIEDLGSDSLSEDDFVRHEVTRIYFS